MLDLYLLADDQTRPDNTEALPTLAASKKIYSKIFNIKYHQRSVRCILTVSLGHRPDPTNATNHPKEKHAQRSHRAKAAGNLQHRARRQ